MTRILYYLLCALSTLAWSAEDEATQKRFEYGQLLIVETFIQDKEHPYFIVIRFDTAYGTELFSRQDQGTKTKDSKATQDMAVEAAMSEVAEKMHWNARPSPQGGISRDPWLLDILGSIGWEVYSRTEETTTLVPTSSDRTVVYYLKRLARR